MCSARAILARWSKTRVLLILVAAALPLAASEDLAALVKAYRNAPSMAQRARLERFASQHAKDQDGSLAWLALGITAFEQKDYDRAIRSLKTAQPRLPKV